MAGYANRLGLHRPFEIRFRLAEAASIRTFLAHLGETTTAPVLTPRARAPPELETDWVGTRGFRFDQTPPWDSTTPPPDSGYRFDQTLD